MKKDNLIMVQSYGMDFTAFTKICIEKSKSLNGMIVSINKKYAVIQKKI